MTSLDTLESSTQDSRPVELFRVVLGADEWLWTNSEDTITIGSEDFLPEPGIRRGRITKGRTAKDVVVTVGSANTFAKKYVTIPPGQLATLSVYLVQRDESPAYDTVALLFEGAVHGVKFGDDGHTAGITARSGDAAFDELAIPRRTYQSNCNNSLYDEYCGANPAFHNHIGAANSVTGNVIEIVGLNASGIDATGGYVRPVGTADFRQVIAQSGDNVTLLLPFLDSVLGQDIQAFRGCDHDLFSDCALTFDNTGRFNGFAFVPNRNIFERGIRV